MKNYYLTASIFVAVISFLILTALTWSDLPVVGIEEGGQCVYIETAPDFKRSPCPSVLPEKYNSIFVSARLLKG
tara:strand:- start:859 stop:1080 length:222 start_codon:yes stop_codon:yes gene_type:complete